MGLRLRELATRGQSESGGGIHATYEPLFRPALYMNHILHLALLFVLSTVKLKGVNDL